MNKVIMNSLPTREKPCGEELYLQCVARKVNERAQDLFHCNLHPLLPHNQAKDTCPNQVAKNLLIIWSTAMVSKKYEDCLNIQPCSQVLYSTRTHTENVNAIVKYPEGSQGKGNNPKGGNSKTTKKPPKAKSGKGGKAARIKAPSLTTKQEDSHSIIYLTFENDLVQVIEDQYVYSIMGIISEIGGAVGILVGMSVMTIVEYFLMLQKKAALLKKHFQEASNIVQPVRSCNSINQNTLIKSPEDNGDERDMRLEVRRSSSSLTITEEINDDKQNKKAKTLKETCNTHFTVARKGSMIPTLSNKLGLFENLE